MRDFFFVFFFLEMLRQHSLSFQPGSLAEAHTSLVEAVREGKGGSKLSPMEPCVLWRLIGSKGDPLHALHKGPFVASLLLQGLGWSFNPPPPLWQAVPDRLFPPLLFSSQPHWREGGDPQTSTWASWSHVDENRSPLKKHFINVVASQGFYSVQAWCPS